MNTDIDVLKAISLAHKAAWSQLGDAMGALCEDSDPLELRWFAKWAGGENRAQPHCVVAANWNYDVELAPDPEQLVLPAHEESWERRDRERKNQVREILAQFDWTGADDADHYRATTFGDLIERCGGEIDWCDQVGECDECNGALETEPSHYGWLPSYWNDHEGTMICEWCLEADPTPYLEWLEGNPKRALTLSIDLAEYGYKKLEQDFETGMHRGQDDSPELAAERLEALGCEKFIFEITDKGQFDVRWCVWIHEDEWESSRVPTTRR